MTFFPHLNLCSHTIQFFLHLHQIFSDMYLLWTDSLALTTFDAVLGFGTLWNLFRPAPLGISQIAVDMIFIPYAKASRNVHSCRTWHTVSAGCTAVLYTLVQCICTWQTASCSASFNGSKSVKVFRLSSTCSMLDIPLSTTLTLENVAT